MLLPNPQTLRQRTIAAAGLLQALVLLQEQADIKRQPATSKYFLKQSIRSLLILDPKDVEEVYDGAAGVQKGLEVMEQISHVSYASYLDRNELIGYTLGTLKIARYLDGGGYDNIRKLLRERLETMRKSYLPLVNRTKDPDNAALYAEIDQVYRQTISKLPYRVRLFGHPDRLNVVAVAHKLRTLLLSAIRSAVLWRQYGGNLLGLFLERQRVHDQTKALLCQIQDHERSLQSK